MVPCFRLTPRRSVALPQASAIILNECIRACPGITQLEIFAVILAAAVHDVGHMAVNNDFLINTRHPNAITYNDLSVNENFHISQAFGIAFSDPSRNIFQQFSVQVSRYCLGFIAPLHIAAGPLLMWFRMRLPTRYPAPLLQLVSRHGTPRHRSSSVCGR